LSILYAYFFNILLKDFEPRTSEERSALF